MENKYYAVTTKCGHVGKGKFYIVTFAVKALTKKEAAEKARWIPRVKHHCSDVILDIKEISYDAYELLREENNNNPYLRCNNPQDQRIMCPDIEEYVYNCYEEEKDYSNERRERMKYISKKNKDKKNDLKFMLRDMNNNFELAY